MPVLSLPDANINYMCVERAEEAGTGTGVPDLVLVHGLAANLGFWYLRLAPVLARQYRVIMLDLRGHGRSSAPPTGYSPGILAGDLGALLDYLGIERAHLLGHSYGGCVALHFACESPERVASLTLADVRLRSVQPRLNLRQWRAWPRYRQNLSRAGIELDEDTGDLGFEFFERLARLRLENPAMMEQMQHVIPSPFNGRNGDAAARRWLQLLETTTAQQEFIMGERVPLDRLPALAVATLLVYGEFSQALPTAAALKRAMRDARLEIVPGVGHFFPISYPEKLLEPLLAFIENCESPALEAVV